MIIHFLPQRQEIDSLPWPVVKMLAMHHHISKVQVHFIKEEDEEEDGTHVQSDPFVVSFPY